MIRCYKKKEKASLLHTLPKDNNGQVLSIACHISVIILPMWMVSLLSVGSTPKARNTMRTEVEIASGTIFEPLNDPTRNRPIYDEPRIVEFIIWDHNSRGVDTEEAPMSPPLRRSVDTPFTVEIA